MGVTTFDTLKFVRRLEEVGVPSEQAEVQAEVLTEAFYVNLEELVTKDYLAARFAEQIAYMDTRFAEERSKTDTQFAKVETKLTLHSWMLGLVLLTQVGPFLEWFFAL